MSITAYLVFGNLSAASLKGSAACHPIPVSYTHLSKCLKFTTELGLPENQGVCFEEFLTELK